ncbi:MAG: heavy-metal-associated domain-containing protein [Bacteroidetes bacterium]|nr:heavy-metal-associated domain-containing protein [Bacteroidota bacterium]
MRYIVLYISLFLCGLHSQAQIHKATLQASGLTCAMCARSVFKSLETLPFVDSIDTDLVQSAFVLLFKKDASIDADQIRKRVEDAGFSVASLHMTASFHHLQFPAGGHIMMNGRIYHILGKAGQMLDGDLSMLVVDKLFLSAKDQKKYASLSHTRCYMSGRTESPCCTAFGMPVNQRIYHLSL